MALENADLLVVQKAGGGELRKTTVQQLLADIGGGDVSDLQQVTDAGNNTTNHITIDTVKIVLNADGSATFGGIVKAPRATFEGIVKGYRFVNDQNTTSDPWLKGVDASGTQTFSVTNDGTGTFAGRVTAAGYALAQLQELPE